MTFELTIRRKEQPDVTWTERYDREIGQANCVRGVGQQPEFAGDIHLWGRDIVAWFNETRTPGEKEREYVSARML